MLYLHNFAISSSWFYEARDFVFSLLFRFQWASFGSYRESERLVKIKHSKLICFISSTQAFVAHFALLCFALNATRLNICSFYAPFSFSHDSHYSQTIFDLRNNSKNKSLSLFISTPLDTSLQQRVFLFHFFDIPSTLIEKKKNQKTKTALTCKS